MRPVLFQLLCRSSSPLPVSYRPDQSLDEVLDSSFLQVYSVKVCQHLMYSRGKMSSPTTTLNWCEGERGGASHIMDHNQETFGGGEGVRPTRKEGLSVG